MNISDSISKILDNNYSRVIVPENVNDIPNMLVSFGITGPYVDPVVSAVSKFDPSSKLLVIYSENNDVVDYDEFVDLTPKGFIFIKSLTNKISNES